MRAVRWMSSALVRQSPRVSSARTSGRRKKFGGASREPVSDQPHPLAHGRVGTAKAIAERCKRPQQIDGTSRAVIDRKGLDGKAGRAEGPDRACHMMRRG